jgi:hypothetical protein
MPTPEVTVDGEGGAVAERVIAIPVSEAVLTVSGACPVVPLKEACTWVVPAATAVTTPFGATVETVAVAGTELAQVASAVMSCLVPSLNCARAE